MTENPNQRVKFKEEDWLVDIAGSPEVELPSSKASPEVQRHLSALFSSVLGSAYLCSDTFLNVVEETTPHPLLPGSTGEDHQPQWKRISSLQCLLVKRRDKYSESKYERPFWVTFHWGEDQKWMSYQDTWPEEREVSHPPSLTLQWDDGKIQISIGPWPSSTYRVTLKTFFHCWFSMTCPWPPNV